MLVDIIQVCHILKALIYIEKPVAFHRRICVKQRKCLCLPACGNPACANVIFQGKILTAVQIRACLYTDLTPAGISVQKVHKTIHQKTGSNRQKQYYKQDAPSDIFFGKPDLLYRLWQPSVRIFYCSSHSVAPLSFYFLFCCDLLSQKTHLPSSKIGTEFFSRFSFVNRHKKAFCPEGFLICRKVQRSFL